MTVILVAHHTELPAVDGMIAGMIAAERDAVAVMPVTGGAGLGRQDCCQHVLAAAGELAPNGVFWAEWATGRLAEPSMQAAAVARHPALVVTVAINPAIAAHITVAERIAYHALMIGRPLERLTVAEQDGVYLVCGAQRDESGPLSRWVRDAFSRPLRLAAGVSAHSSLKSDPTGTVRLLLVGNEDLLRNSYPANLVAIGDAAEQLGLGVEVSFWEPRDDASGSVQARLAGIDGILLPGGSDMEQVSGQIAVAQAAIRQDLPMMGLCLGMQSMATAVVREISGCPDANLAEADPATRLKTFIRLRDGQGQPEWRVGLHRSRLVPGTKLSRIFGGAATVAIPCNHRYALDPDLHPMLARAGLTVSGFQRGRDLADAIELAKLCFFIGMQGHPELMTRRGAPQPLMLAFLRAVAGR